MGSGAPRGGGPGAANALLPLKGEPWQAPWRSAPKVPFARQRLPLPSPPPREPADATWSELEGGRLCAPCPPQSSLLGRETHVELRRVLGKLGQPG